ncbi:RimK/LysX family protein [Kiritimatiellaeota bacterium B1221]|nr:RimK/LysX family protein [Kiritimatiellaeota bacterium B1221]
MKKTDSNRVEIGWREWIELPDWGLRLKAKMDTGAKSSSLDVEQLEFLPHNRVRFGIHQLRKTDSIKMVEAELFDTTKVRSSNGLTQKRIVVKTRIRLAGIEKEILVNLTNRRKMLHRILLGREALQEHFLIDAGVDHVVTPPRLKKSSALKGK